MQYNISFDIAAIFNLLFILFIYKKKVKIRSFQNNLLLIMIIDCFAASVFDVLSSIATNHPHFFPLFLINLWNELFYITGISVAFLYAFHNLMITDTYHSLNQYKKFFLYLPEALCIIIAICNPFTKLLFYYDENLNYHHGFGIYFYFFTILYYLLFTVINAYSNRNRLEKSKLYSLYFFGILYFCAIMIQTFFPSQLIEMFAASLCILITLINIQNPEKLINSRTDLLNRDAMSDVVQKKFYAAEKFTIISIKIKDLKFLSKTFGSSYTNATIKNVAEFLQTFRTKNTRIFHIGFGQFCFLYPALNTEEIETIIEILKRRFSAPWNTDGIEVNLDLCLNIGHAPEDFSDFESLSEFVDYKPEEENFCEKENCICENFQIIYAKDTNLNRKKRTLAIEHAIRRALRNQSFQVYYQPIYSTKEKKFTCAEALIRLWDRECGVISPEEFIPIAEKNGTILEIGLFVFDSVCQFISAAHLEDLGVKYIEINLSVIQCMQTKLTEELLSIMTQYHIRPDQINLEITETAAAVSPETLKLNMQQLSKESIRFSLDDYGTGYSTMSYALDLPFSYIKLDKSIVSSASSDNNTHIALISTIQMMKQLDFQIIAEGVEDKEQLDMLIEEGCDYIQGYYFSKPLPKDAYLNFLHSRNLE